ncbi:MAG: polysaccharide deacetylase family protein [Rhizobiaceae bacterium]|nr:polysaccharide deacetylase family protein [Rhizobiaceae bacterium]
MPEANAIWRPLVDELERRARPARFWLRDDDAIEPTPALERLLTFCERTHVPLVLAVIPQPTGQALADRLETTRNASVAVHGWAHRNHAGASEKKQELGPHRPRAEVLGELREGLLKLKTLHGPRALPMLVPPWNRIDSNLLPHLAHIGFEALSAFGPAKPAPIRTINSNVDLIDWHGTRGCREYSLLVDAIVAQLRLQEPVGILGHHLVHDEATWQFLEKLFEVTRPFGVEWLRGEDLLKCPE